MVLVVQGGKPRWRIFVELVTKSPKQACGAAPFMPVSSNALHTARDVAPAGAIDDQRANVLIAAERQRWADVARDAQRLLELPEHQGDAALWTALGKALTALERWDAALAAFDRARGLTPENDLPTRLALLRERRIPFYHRRAVGMLAD